MTFTKQNLTYTSSTFSPVHACGNTLHGEALR